MFFFFFFFSSSSPSEVKLVSSDVDVLFWLVSCLISCSSLPLRGWTMGCQLRVPQEHSRGKGGAVFVWIYPLKRNPPTLGGCISVQMASSKKAMLNASKGTSKHRWLFRGPVSFSSPSQTYKDYSCVHNTGCHTYTLWINRYYFHWVKGKRQGWSNIGVVVTVRMFSPLHVFSFRVRQRSCCYP